MRLARTVSDATCRSRLDGTSLLSRAYFAAIFVIISQQIAHESHFLTLRIVSAALVGNRPTISGELLALAFNRRCPCFVEMPSLVDLFADCIPCPCCPPPSDPHSPSSRCFVSKNARGAARQGRGRISGPPPPELPAVMAPESRYCILAFANLSSQQHSRRAV